MARVIDYITEMQKDNEGININELVGKDYELVPYLGVGDTIAFAIPTDKWNGERDHFGEARLFLDN
jgi:hypothetical protein